MSIGDVFRTAIWTSIAIVFGLTISNAVANAAPPPVRGTVEYCQANAAGIAERACIVRVIFAPVNQSRRAVRVAWCESRLDPRARNGTHLGIFQLGAPERRRYGHGRTVAKQAWAARRLWHDRGWQPWVCR